MRTRSPFRALRSAPLAALVIAACADPVAVPSSPAALNAPEAPDLTVTSVTAQNATAGGSIVMSAVVRNAGTGGAGESTLRFFLSATPGAAPTAAGTDAKFLQCDKGVAKLAAGASLTVQQTCAVPATVPAGSYYALAYADASAKVTESNETNNVGSSTDRYTVTRLQPDLVIASVTGQNAVAGGTMAVAAVVSNAGTATAGESTLRFVLVTAPNVTAGAKSLECDKAITSLAAGASRSEQQTCTVPKSTPAGSYYVMTMADAMNKVSESNETNNVGTSTDRYTITRNQPDLVIVSVAAANATLGGTMVFTAVVKNAGTGNAGESTVRFFLSATQDLTTTATGTATAAKYLQCDKGVAGLAAGASLTLQQTCTVTTNVPAGSYFALAYADANNKVSESNETNNVGSSSGKYTITLPTPGTPAGPAPGATAAPGPLTEKTTVSLRWTASPGASSYSVVVTDVAGATPAVAKTATGASLSVALAPGKQYRWTVSACNTTGCSAATAPLFFHTP